MDWSGVYYCDVIISCLDSHSDGTHSLHPLSKRCNATCLQIWWRHKLILDGLRMSTFKKNNNNNFGFVSRWTSDMPWSFRWDPWFHWQLHYICWRVLWAPPVCVRSSLSGVCTHPLCYSNSSAIQKQINWNKHNRKHAMDITGYDALHLNSPLPWSNLYA